MSLFKKIFGPSFKELAEMELELIAGKNKLALEIEEVFKEDAFREKLKNWEPPIIKPPRKIGKYELNMDYTYEDVVLDNVPDDLPFSFDMVSNIVKLDVDSDSKLVSVIWNDTRVGTLPNNRLQEMVYDFKMRADPIYSIFSNFEVNEETELIEGIELFLGFYTDPLRQFEGCDKLQTRIMKSSSKDILGNSRQDNFTFVDEGDVLTLEYDHGTETYIILNEYGEEIGETSIAISKKLQEHDDEREYAASVKKRIEGDDGKVSATITIYL